MSDKNESHTKVDLNEDRIKLLLNEHKHKISDLLDNKLNERIEREKRILRPVVLLIGAFVAVLAWLGWDNIESLVDDEVDDILEKHLVDSTPAKYEDLVKDLYNELLVQAFYTTLPVRYYYTLTSHKVSTKRQDDIDRLIVIALDTDTPEAMFFDVSDILFYLAYEHELKIEQADLIHNTIINTEFDDYPHRRATLIRILSSTRLMGLEKSRVRQYLTSDVDLDLKLAAMAYAAALGDYQAIRHLKQMVQSKSISDIQVKYALIALNLLSPHDEEVAAYFAKLETDSISVMDIYTYLNMLKDIATQLSLGMMETNDSNEAKFLNIAKRLHEHEFYIRCMDDAGSFILNYNNSGTVQEVALTTDWLLQAGVSDVISRAMQMYIEDGDSDSIRNLILRYSVEYQHEHGIEYLLHIAPKDGAVLLLDGRAIGYEELPDGMYIYGIKDVLQDDKIICSWVNLLGKPDHGLLHGFRDLSVKDTRISRAPSWLQEQHYRVVELVY